MNSRGLPPRSGSSSSFRAVTERSSGSTPIASDSSSRLPTSKVSRVPVRIVCTPGSNMLEYTHAFLSAYSATHHRPQIAQRMSVAVYELLENAMNYGGISSEIVLELSELPGQVAVRVTNEAIAARISMLAAHLARVRADAEGTFVEEMKRSVMGGAPRAMLGLARVAFEANMEIKLEIDGRLVAVTASTRM